MPEAADHLDSPLWRYAVPLYAKTGVAEACLELQGRHGLDVNLVLYCCWTGAEGHQLTADEIAHLVAVGGSDDKPQIVMVFAFIVVIDLWELVDDCSDTIQLARRNRHGSQGTGTNGIGPEYRTDTTNIALRVQILQCLDHLLFRRSEFLRDLGKGPGHQWQTMLEIIQ